MKTTVIKVQEVDTQIELSYLDIKLNSNDTYNAKDQNGKELKFKPIRRPDEMATYMIFENGKVRLSKPVKFLENVK